MTINLRFKKLCSSFNQNNYVITINWATKCHTCFHHGNTLAKFEISCRIKVLATFCHPDLLVGEYFFCQVCIEFHPALLVGEYFFCQVYIEFQPDLLAGGDRPLLAQMQPSEVRQVESSCF